MNIDLTDGLPRDFLSETVAKLQLADPVAELELDGRLLCRNVLVIGGVGSGKTTSVISPLLRQVIGFHAGEAQKKCGLFVIDSKIDGTMERVIAWAKECGRESDLRVLGGPGAWGYDPFNSVKSLFDIARTAEKIASGFKDSGSDNAYWNSTATDCLQAALTLIFLKEGRLELHRTLDWLGSTLVTTNNAPHSFREFQIIVANELGNEDSGAEFPTIRSTVLAAQRTLESYHKLDHKTRTILQTIFSVMVRSLTSISMNDYYPGTGRKAIDIAEIVEEGRILVLRAPAHEPTIIEALGRMIKCDLYGQIRSRRIGARDEGRLFGLFFDEYPLVATGSSPLFGDVEALQTMREKRGFVVAATQGLVSMRNAVGNRAWDSLALNFTNKIFLASQETEVEAFACAVLGTRDTESVVQTKQKTESPDADDPSRSAVMNREFSIRHEANVIQPGDIARLSEHSGYYSLAGGVTSPAPVFFVPDFTQVTFHDAGSLRNQVDAEMAKFRQKLNPESSEEQGTSETKDPETPTPPVEASILEPATPPSESEIAMFPIFGIDTCNSVRVAWLDSSCIEFDLFQSLPGEPPSTILEFLLLDEDARNAHFANPAVRQLVYSALAATEAFNAQTREYFESYEWSASRKPTLAPEAREAVSRYAREWMTALQIPVDDLCPRERCSPGKRAGWEEVLRIEVPRKRTTREFLHFLMSLKHLATAHKTGPVCVLWFDGLPVLQYPPEGWLRQTAVQLVGTLSALASLYIIPGTEKFLAQEEAD